MNNNVEIRANCPACGATFRGDAYFDWNIPPVMKAYRQFHRRHKNHQGYEETA